MNTLCCTLIILSCLSLISGLYESTPWINKLNASNYDNEISASNHLIQYYSSGCSHCIQYSPIFSNLTNKLKYWNSYIKISIIDCFIIENVSKCSVRAVPKIKCAIKGRQQEELEHTPKSEEELATQLSECLINDAGQVDRMLKESLNPEFILKSSNRTGLLNLLVTLRGKTKIQFNAQYSELDAFEAIDPMGNMVKRGSFEDIINYFNPSFLTEVDTTQAPQVEKIKPKNHNYNIYEEDVRSSLILLLRNDVSLTGTFDDISLKALCNFIQLTLKYLNLSQDFKVSLQKTFDYLNTITSLTGQEWLQKLDEFSFPNSQPEYVACLGSEKNLRGYPCGLWMIFHSLTVGEYLESPNEMPETPYVLNRFVPIFFSCQNCGVNFAIETAGLAPNEKEIFPPSVIPEPSDLEKLNKTERVPAPKTKAEAVYFLNLIHNKVNKRLSGEYTDDKLYPKRLFPTFKMCPQCYSTPLQEEDDKALINWPNVKDQVVDYLVKHYNPFHRTSYKDELSKQDSPSLD